MSQIPRKSSLEVQRLVHISPLLETVQHILKNLHLSISGMLQQEIDPTLFP